MSLRVPSRRSSLRRGPPRPGVRAVDTAESPQRLKAVTQGPAEGRKPCRRMHGPAAPWGIAGGCDVQRHHRAEKVAQRARLIAWRGRIAHHGVEPSRYRRAPAVRATVGVLQSQRMQCLVQDQVGPGAGPTGTRLGQPEPDVAADVGAGGIERVAGMAQVRPGRRNASRRKGRLPSFTSTKRNLQTVSIRAASTCRARWPDRPR